MAEPTEIRSTPTWRFIRASVLVIVGVVIGIVFAIVTIILPRTHELSRLGRESPVLMTFDVAGLIQQATPKPGSQTGSSELLEPTGSQAWARTYTIRCEIPSAEQPKAIETIQGLIQARVSQLGGTASRRPLYQIWVSKRTSRAGIGWRHERTLLEYRANKTAGLIEINGIGQGDEMTFFITIAEH